MSNPISLSTVAERFGNAVPLWRIQKLATQGRIPIRGRFGTTRVVYESDLPEIERTLCDLGLLSTSPAA